MSVNIYMDYMSQPSRAILAYCLAAEIPHKVVEIRLAKLAHKDSEFLKINPFGKVPAIEDQGFTLFESHAILTYLANKHAKTDSFYPKDLKKRALIDAYLHWHHLNTRRCALLFQASNPQFFPGMKLPSVESETKAVKRILKTLEDVFLKDGKYLCGQDSISIADISAACEIAQLYMTNYDLNQHTKLKEWLDRCLAHPAMKEAHKVFFKVLGKIKPNPKL
jgi:Glutathione S-transferase